MWSTASVVNFVLPPLIHFKISIPKDAYIFGT